MSNEVLALLSQSKFVRARLLKLLKEIEDSGISEEALHWKMPFGPNGRAHIGWQMMHAGLTYDKYIHVRVLQQKEKFGDLAPHFGNGSQPDPSYRLTPEKIRNFLLDAITPYYAFFEKLDPIKLDEKPYETADRTYRDILMLMNWHEAEHTGQCQITWNAFKAMKSEL